MLAFCVPDCERVHAVETLDSVFTPPRISLQHDLGVRASVETVAKLLQLAAQLNKVVQLPAKAEYQVRSCPPVGDHRLDAALEVYDREPTVADDRPGRQPQALCIWTAAGHSVGHCLHRPTFGGQVTLPVDPAGDATHRRSLLTYLGLAPI